MKKTNRIIGLLLSCLMLMSLLSVSVFADEGTQENPINANDKWFAATNCFLLNPSLQAGDADGIWYTLTADKDGIIQLENSMKNDYAYQITLWVNGVEYQAYEDGVYNRPINTYPVQTGDVATICIQGQDTSVAGGVYANIKILAGINDMAETIKLKATNIKVYVAAGATVHYQDDSLNAVYAAKGLQVTGSSVENVSVTSVNKTYTDTDKDGQIELKLGGSAGGAGAPPVKPDWAITNNSAEDRCFTLVVVEEAHECVYDNNQDADCNTCGAYREVSEEIFFEIVTFAGNSVSEDVNGLAFKFDVDVSGMAVIDGNCAVYDNTYVTLSNLSGALKLNEMGAVVSNVGTGDYTLNDTAAGMAGVPAVRLFSFDADNNAATFAVRVVDIPDANKDDTIYARSYLVYLDADNNECVLYGDVYQATYNSVTSE